MLRVGYHRENPDNIVSTPRDGFRGAIRPGTMVSMKTRIIFQIFFGNPGRRILKSPSKEGRKRKGDTR